MNNWTSYSPARWLLLLTWLLVIAAPAALGQNNGSPLAFPFQGRLTDSNGNPLNYATNVTFRIYPPSGSCYLYEETHNVSPNAYGIFSVIIGSGTVSPTPTNSLAQVFSNDPTAPLNDSCTTTYSPVTNDWRRLQLVVGGSVTLPTMQTIGSSAFAITAQMLSGKTALDFIQVNSSVSLTQANVETLVTGGDAGLLHHHDSIYSRKDGSTPFTGNISTNQDIYAPTAGGQIGIGTNSANADLHIVKSAPNLRLEATSGSGGNLSVDFYSGSATQRASIRAAEGSDGLKIYSGTQEAINIDASRAVTFQGSIQTLGTVGLGKYTSAQEAALTLALNSLGASATGTMWTNSTTNTIRYWDGADVQILPNVGNTVSSVTVGTGLANSGTALAPNLSVSYGTTSGTALQGNQIFAGDVAGPVGAITVARISGSPIDFSTAPTNGQVLLFDGTNWVPAAPPATGMNSMNGLTAGAQTLATGTTGTAFNISSSGSVHTFNIPLANTAGVTAGLISKSEYDTFNNKQAALGFTPVNRAGDEMTGGLTLSGDPSANLGASTKQYVDAAVSSASANFVRKDGSVTLTANWDVGAWKITNLGTPTAAGDAATKGYVDTGLSGKQDSLGYTPLNVAGGAMSGALTLAADPTVALGAATKQYVDNSVSGASGNFLRIDGTTTLSANWDVGAWRLTNLSAPSAASDAATKGYVDTGLSGKQDSLGYTPLNVAGGAMSGALTLAADPTVALGAATKQYVDNSVSGASGNFLRIDGTTTLSANWNVGAWRLTNLSAPSAASDAATKGYIDTGLSGKQDSLGYTPLNVAGGAMSGALTLAADPTVALGAATKQYVDNSVSGASGNFLRIDGTTTLSANWNVGAWRLTNLGTPTAASDATTKSYVDGAISTAGGNYLYRDGSVSLTGDWDLGGNDLFNTGNIELANQKNLRIGRYTAAQESALTLTLGGADVGRMWYNSTSSDLKYWDGSDVRILGVAGTGILSLNGLSDNNQSFATMTTTGTAPAFVSAAGTHTLAIPMASAAGVTAGLISKTDYDSFAGKQAALGYTPLNAAGGAMTGALTLAADPTVALGAATKQYVDNSVSNAAGSYVLRNGTATLTANWDVGAWKITNLGTPTAAGDAATKGYVDTGLSGKQDSLGFTPLNIAGGAMTGGLTLAGDPTANLGAATKQYVDNSTSTASANYLRKDGSVTLTANWDVGAWRLTNLGAPSASGDAATKGYVDSQIHAGDVNGPYGALTVSRLQGVNVHTAAPSDGYVLTYNSAQTRWEASPAAATGITSLGGLTTATQTFATLTTSGTAPAFISAAGTHTLAIPMASAAGVTAGLLSKTQYDTFAGKQDALGFTPLNIAGGAMTGGLTLSGDPTVNLGAATKQYVDNSVSGAAGSYILRNGSATLTANWDVGAWRLTNVGTPSASGDAATKGYVDSQIHAGDVNGPYGALTVARLQGVNVHTAAPSDGYVLTYNSAQTRWEASPSAATGITSLGGLTTATQTFATLTTSGTAPSFISAAGTHTLAIPMASAAGVTAGLISKTDYDSFAGKQAALGYTPLNAAGGAMTGALTLAADPTVALGAATKQYVDNSVSGAASSYVLRDGTSTLTANWDVGAWKITNLGTPTAAGDAATKGYVDTGLSGKQDSLGFTPLNIAGGAMTGGLTLSGDPTANLGAATKQYVDNSTSTAASNYVRRDGSATLTANWAVGGWDITGVGNLSLAPQKNLAFGGYTNAQESTLTLSLGGGDAGRMWYNTTTNELKYWTGSNASALGVSGSGITSLNGLNTSSQTFAVSTTSSATSPDYVSAAGVHTLRIPMASAAGVTAGLISKSDYDSFAGKQAALGFTPLNIAGGEMTGGLTLSGDPTANLGAATKQYVDNSVSNAAGSYVLRNGSATLTANWDVGAWRLTNLGAPSASGDAATKGYVDSQIHAGDVNGPYGALTVARLQGVNVHTAAPSDGYVLTYNSAQTRWEASAPAAGGITSLGGLTTATQTFATLTTSGTAPAFISAAGTHTLAIPMASAAGVTAGLLSKADYDSFAGKQAALGFTPLNIAGGEMTGGLTLSGDPTANLGAATKQYVDNSVSGAAGSYVLRNGSATLTANWDVGAWKITNLGTPTAAGDAATKGYVDTGLSGKQDSLGFTPLNIAGGEMTGGLTLAGDPTANLGAATKQYVDNSTSTASANYLRKDGSVTLTANWDVGAWRLTNLGTPSASGDAATKGYVDSQIHAGDVNGPYGALTVSRLQGVNVHAAAPSDGYVLTYNSAQTRWEASPAAATGITSLGGLTTATQTFATLTTSGTAPAFISAAGTHTLAIPMASAAGVTAGLISKSDYDSFAGKQAALGFTPLNIAGGEMTGGLTLSGDPTANLGAATKQYVDNSVSGAAGSYVLRNGTATLTANWDVGAWRLTNLGAPSASGDAATKGYVDSQIHAGDVNGPYGALTVARLQGVNVHTAAPSDGYVLTYNSAQTRWEASAPAAGGITSLGGLTTATQTFATLTTSGTAPAFISAAGTHTLAIPMASAAGVTAGLLSKTDYDAFSGKQAALGFTPLNIAGGEMTGGLTLAGDPTANLGAATKQYVDNSTSTASANYLRKDGSVTLSANWDVGAWRLTNLGTPSASGDAATKGYVDSQIHAGDVNGPYGALTVSRLQGVNVHTAAPSDGYVLTYNSAQTRWEASAPAAGGITSLGGLTNATQTFAVLTTSGTAPAFVSAAGTHTLAIPMASAAGVTAGLLSKTDYDAFNGKQAALGFTPLNIAGGAMTGALTLAADPTINLGAATKQYVDNSISTAAASYIRRDGTATLTANWNAGTLSITAGGFSGGAFFYTSDRRLKKNIETIEGLELIKRLRGVAFEWRKDSSPDIGLIAQEVEAVAPELVQTDATTGFKSVKYGNLVGPLIEATKSVYGMCEASQDQITRIDQKLNRHIASTQKLNSEVETLRNQVQSLKGENEALRRDLEALKELVHKRLK